MTGEVENVGTARPRARAVPGLAGLVGAHPGTLARMFGAGSPTDPAELGDVPEGRILSFEPLSGLFLVTRALVRAVDAAPVAWSGKVFDHGGNSGQNVLFGRRTMRFRAEVEASSIDGKPALVFHYGDPAFKNPWPVRALLGELRTIGEGLAVGPASLLGGAGAVKRLFWWGLAAKQAD